MNNNIKTKKIIAHILYFLFCEVIFIGIFSLIMINFSPYMKVKSALFGTSSNNKTVSIVSSNKIDRAAGHPKPVIKSIKKTPIKTNASAAQAHGIKVIKIKELHFSGILILVKDPSRIDVGLTPYLGHVGATLKEIIAKSKAVGGINAGGFVDTNRMGTGGSPTGIIIQNGKITYTEKKSPSYSIIGFNYKNKFITSNSMSLKEISEIKFRCAASFGPVLISSGRPLRINRGFSPQPRSAIGQRKDGTVMLMAIDGRQLESRGANFTELQKELLKYGAYNAANLDGGSSTTIIYQDKTLNNPSDIVGDRSIPSAFLIMPQKN